jgi:hypothetical protein
MIITHVYRDEDMNEYLVTIFDDGVVRLAIRPKGNRTWSAPIAHIRTERTDTE